MAKEVPTYADHIIQDAAILLGTPVVRGTRVPVEIVLEYLAQTPDFDELFAEYPRLTMDDGKACFAFAQTLFAGTPRRNGITLS